MKVCIIVFLLGKEFIIPKHRDHNFAAEGITWNIVGLDEKAGRFENMFFYYWAKMWNPYLIHDYETTAKVFESHWKISRFCYVTFKGRILFSSVNICETHLTDTSLNPEESVKTGELYHDEASGYFLDILQEFLCRKILFFSSNFVIISGFTSWELFLQLNLPL